MIRKQMEEDLTKSASDYANLAENTISKLQQAYLKKYHPRHYSQSTQDPLNKWVRDKESGPSHRQQGVMPETEFAQSDDGIGKISISSNLVH